MLGNLRADIPPEPEPARGSAGLLKQLRALPWLWLSALGVKRAGDLGTSIGHKIVMHRKSYKEFVMGQAAWGEKNPGPAGTTSAFPQAFAVPLPGCCFLTLFNVLLHIMEGTTGTLERILEFSQACTVFVVEVREHPREQSCGSLCVSKAVFVFPVRTSSAWWIPRDCNAMPVNMH